MLTFKIGNIETDIIGYTDFAGFDSEYLALRKKMSFRPEGYLFSPMFKKHKWDGWKRLIWKNTKRCYFPTGLFSIAKQHFKERNIPVKIIDSRIKPEKNLFLDFNYKDFPPREYQQRGIDSCLDVTKGGRGIIWFPTGSGKTIMSAGIIKGYGVAPFLFLVTSIDLLEQTAERLSETLLKNGYPAKIGKVGGGIVDIQDITVMTVQTAVRVLGKKYIKFDSESKDDKTDLTLIQEHKEEILSLMRNAKGVLADECQHWRADICQLVTNNLKSAYYRIAVSATPYRDNGDDLLVQSCFGKTICEIKASELIKTGFLVKPHIHFIHINPKPSQFKNWQNIYKEQVVENDYYNTLIANIAEEYISAERLVLVLVQQIEHGKTLENTITGGVFVNGASPKNERLTALKRLKNRQIRCIISTSLPYEEVLLVKDKGIIKQIEIGDLCNNYKKQVDNGEFETCCSFDGKTCSWSKITATHIHERKNKIVRVESNHGEDILVTENHSLIRPDLSSVLPEQGEQMCVPVGIPKKSNPSTFINVAELLKDINDPTIEVEVLGLTHPILRKIKSQYNYTFNGPKSVCKSTRTDVRKRTKGKEKRYFTAIYQLINYFKYYKYRYRAKLSDVWFCNELFEEFECRIYIRRSRKDFDLPTKLPITKELSILSGLMCGDGHIKHHLKGKSMYVFDFSGLLDMSKSSEGHNDIDKMNVRPIFKKCFYSVFGNVKLWENWQHIRFRSKLMYYLFRQLGHVNIKGEKRVPDYIYNSKEEIQKNFLWGLYLSDGSKKFNYSKPIDIDVFTGISIHNTSRPLISGVCSLLNILKIRYYCNYTITKNKPRYDITIVDNLLELQTTRKRNHMLFSISNRVQKKVEILERNDKFVYDISVEGCHNFVAGSGGILAHNSIYDEGIDCRPLDTLILAGGGKSPVRAMQRIGRTLRPYEGKTSATVIDFFIHEKYLYEHAKAREKMYKTEEEFVIEHNFID